MEMARPDFLPVTVMLISRYRERRSFRASFRVGMCTPEPYCSLRIPGAWAGTGSRFAAELFWSELFGMPAEDFSGEDRTITPDSDFVGIEVRPLARLRSRETAQHLALGIDLQDTARYGVGHVQEVVGSDHQAKGMPEFPLPQEAPAGIEDLDARVLPVTDIDEITVNGDGMGGVELSRPGALHSPARQHIAVLVELQHPRIA